MYKRQDNYALAIEGVVAQTLSSFNLHEEYHTPRDEADTLDYGHLEAAARVAQSAAATLASGALKPAWREGMQPRKLNKGPGAQAGAHGEGADEGRSAGEGAKDGDEEDEDG